MIDAIQSSSQLPEMGNFSLASGDEKMLAIYFYIALLMSAQGKKNSGIDLPERTLAPSTPECRRLAFDQDKGCLKRTWRSTAWLSTAGRSTRSFFRVAGFGCTFLADFPRSRTSNPEIPPRLR